MCTRIPLPHIAEADYFQHLRSHAQRYVRRVARYGLSYDAQRRIRRIRKDVNASSRIGSVL